MAAEAIHDQLPVERAPELERQRETPDLRQALGEKLDRVKVEIDDFATLLSTYDPTVPPTRISADWIRGVLEARRRRTAIFGPLFADPAWDMLLELYALQLEGKRAVVTDVCAVAAVPYTTALRWISNLEGAELVVRTADRVDRRRTWVDLSRRGDEAMKRYFRDPQSGGAGI